MSNTEKLLSVVQEALRFVHQHWITLLMVGVVLALLVVIERVLVEKKGPRDLTGNGITVGAPKVFDSRSLSLMLEQLNASLKGFNILSQNVAQSLAMFQQQRSTDVDRKYRAGAKLAPVTAKAAQGGSAKTKEEKSGDSNETSETSVQDKKQPTADGSDSSGGFNPAFGVAATDALTDQLNLTYQIFNLRILNERALSDRLYNGTSRLQAVLGFQISLMPPRGTEDCVAIAEIGLKLKGSDGEVSLVALIPQEKTYNAATLSSKADSLDGSVVWNVLDLGYGHRRRSKELYIHRDSDTVAFERNPGWAEHAFGQEERNAQDITSRTVFGWEFRPVLGRRSVTAGTRQMLAVISLPAADTVPQVDLEVRTRTYWRKLDRKLLTTSLRWWLWPFWPDRSRLIEVVRDLTIPSASAQEQLAPDVKKIEWVDAGEGSAIILVSGNRFFSGTQVILGGAIHSDPETGLLLKSDQALEIHTKISALANGDAVLSGRFGASKPLVIDPASLPSSGIYIDSMNVQSGPDNSFFRIRVVIRSTQASENKTVSVEQLKKLPEPILYVGQRPVPLPYDYQDCYSSDSSLPKAGSDLPTDAFQVEAWIPAELLKGEENPVLFKVPFCGSSWATESPLLFSVEPVVIRLGGDSTQNLIFSSPTDFVQTSGEKWYVDLDRTYELGTSDFERIGPRQLRLRLDVGKLSQFDKCVLRFGSKLVYTLNIPKSAPSPVPALDDQQSPLVLLKGKSAVHEWKGTNLEGVTKATCEGKDLSFFVNAKGTKLTIFLGTKFTSKVGKHDLRLHLDGGQSLCVPVFVSESVKTQDTA